MGKNKYSFIALTLGFFCLFVFWCFFSKSDPCIQSGDKLLGRDCDQTPSKNRFVSSCYRFWLKRSDRSDTAMISSGYPAARRCHSCVQVKDGEQDCTLYHLDTPAWTVFLKHTSRCLSHQRCLYVGVTTERWSCLTCGSWTCRLSGGPSCLLSCRNQRTSTVLQSLRYVKNHLDLSLFHQCEGKSWSGVCSSSGRMYVRPRRSRQHVWESKNWLLVQSVVGGAQPAGNVLGKTTENLPSHSSAVHPSAARPGTVTHADPATQIDRSINAGGEECVRKG